MGTYLKYRFIQKLTSKGQFKLMVRLEGLEPPRTGRQILSLVRLPIPPQPPFNMEATSRFELEMKELQSSALPLGYVAILLIF